MRDHSNHITATREQAVEAILGACTFGRRVEEVSVADAIGRVLAEDALALIAMPNALTSTRDAVAVHWDDFAELADGQIPDTSAWVRGRDWQFCNTGVGMPEGFDTAIAIEQVEVSADEQRVRLLAVPAARYDGTRPAGDDFPEGELLAPAGALVTPLLASHIASGGNVSVHVVAKPRVAFLPTGGELVPIGADVPAGKNIETNSILMRAKIESWGGEALLFPITPDDPEAIEAALRKAVGLADIVVLNAGSSKGSDDWSCEVLEDIGTVLFHEVNHGAGHHSFAAVVEGVPVVGISGPPGGAAFTTDFYLYPVLRAYLGLSPRLERIIVRMGEDLPDMGGGVRNAARAAELSAEPPAQPRFFRIRRLVLQPADDGVPMAHLVSKTHPSPAQADSAQAYYAQPMGEGFPAACAGDLVEVELRPEFGFEGAGTR